MVGLAGFELQPNRGGLAIPVGHPECVANLLGLVMAD
jgi:hypothetical protein